MNKYRAKKVSLDGLTFASKAEAKRYSELRLLERAKEISGLQLQIPFELMAYSEDDSMAPTVGHYVSDFVYRDTNNKLVVEDVKGFRTPLYKWKKKHFEIQYGIKITEVRA